MMPQSRVWTLILLMLAGCALATLLAVEPAQVPSQPAQTAAPAPAPRPEDIGPSTNPWAMLAATVVLHLVATAVALRLGMKIFYESTMAGGFVAIVGIDTLIGAAMTFCGPLTEGFTAMLGPQLVVTALVMVVTLHRYGFTKARFTVIPTVLVTKAFGFFGEVALRMLFLEAMLRWAAMRGW